MCALLAATGACRTSSGGFGEEYLVVIADAVIAARDGNGDPWDADGTPPDVYAELAIDGEIVLVTDVIDNELEPAWNEAAGPFVIEGDTELYVDVYDEDLPGRAEVMFCPPDGAVLREELADGMLACVFGNGASAVTILFEDPTETIFARR